jgi:hypothetical protein
MSAEQIISQSLKSPEECSLYRALRWIAFKDKVIDEITAKNLYQPRFEVKQNFKYDAHSSWFESEIKWKSSDDKESFEEAIRLLKTRLYIGDIKAKGFPLIDELTNPKGIIRSQISNWYKSCESSYYDISLKFWDSSARVDWIESEAENITHTLRTDEKYRAYASIIIKTDELKKFFPSKDNKKSSGGRPPEYDWASFNAEIAKIAHHPDGLPDKQADLEKKMSQWCINTWDKQPSESLIRDKISKIYQSIKKAKN